MKILVTCGGTAGHINPAVALARMFQERMEDSQVLFVGAKGGMEERLVLDAVRSAALTCYAVEGAYPQSLEALKHGYGLAYNEDAYIVVYDAFASNVMPDIQVLRKGAERP